MNKILIYFFFTFVTNLILVSNPFEYNYYNKIDSSYNCSLVVLPDSSEIKGLIVRDYSSLPEYPKKYPYKWRDLALEEDLVVLYIVSSNYFPELCYDDSPLFIIDTIIRKTIDKYNIPKRNIFIGGISASGTRALRYAQFCEKGKSSFGIKINSVFSVDSPLDLERFYLSVHNHKKYFKAGMLWEANLMTSKFEERFGGSPDEKFELYWKNSVFSYKDSALGNSKYLMNTSLIFFHEPDIDWWIKERGATYYDINSFDITGIYNHLLYLGHKDIELVTTTGKGFDKNGNRKCHSWTIVDEEYLIDWIVKRLK